MNERAKNRLFQISDHFDNSVMFMAVRHGMVMMIPLLVSGSVALMLGSLPIPMYQEFLSQLWNGRVVEFLWFIQSASFGFFAVGCHSQRALVMR